MVKHEKYGRIHGKQTIERVIKNNKPNNAIDWIEKAGVKQINSAEFHMSKLINNDTWTFFLEQIHTLFVYICWKRST